MSKRRQSSVLIPCTHFRNGVIRYRVNMSTSRDQKMMLIKMSGKAFPPRLQSQFNLLVWKDESLGLHLTQFINWAQKEKTNLSLKHTQVMFRRFKEASSMHYTTWCKQPLSVSHPIKLNVVKEGWRADFSQSYKKSSYALPKTSQRFFLEDICLLVCWQW